MDKNDFEMIEMMRRLADRLERIEEKLDLLEKKVVPEIKAEEVNIIPVSDSCSYDASKNPLPPPTIQTKTKTLVMSTIEKKRPHQASNRYQDWSKLSPDLLQRILEGLNFIDFSRAKTVCLDWYSVWRTCVKPPRYPWQIIFKQDGSSMLYDPKEDKSYDTEKLLGHRFSDNSHCLNTSGNWLLMLDYSHNKESRLDPYLLNVFTQKRINLPSMESSSVLGGKKSIFQRRGKEYFLESSGVPMWASDIVYPVVYPILSVNEETEDYFVVWVFYHRYVYTHKKGDDSWRELIIQGTYFWIIDLAYKNNNNKLYLITNLTTAGGHIQIFDFSGDFPKEEIHENPHHGRLGPYYTKKLAITNSAEVLIILSIRNALGNDIFNVFKMNLESKIWEKVNSIGDNEMLIFGHGVTIKAQVKEVGDIIKGDSICFADKDFQSCGVFDLAKGRVVKKFDVFSTTRWFVPGFA